eukprot:scaffold86447_cov56-Phaeocystis_antarctica.AAC.3
MSWLLATLPGPAEGSQHCAICRRNWRSVARRRRSCASSASFLSCASWMTIHSSSRPRCRSASIGAYVRPRSDGLALGWAFWVIEPLKALSTTKSARRTKRSAAAAPSAWWSDMT